MESHKTIIRRFISRYPWGRPDQVTFSEASSFAMTGLVKSQVWSTETLATGADVLAQQAVKSECPDEKRAMEAELRDRCMCVHK